MKQNHPIGWMLILAVAGLASWATAQEPASAPASAPTAASNTPAEATPSAEEVMKQLLEKRQPTTAAEPTRRPAATDVPAGSVTPASDPGLMGTAPNLFAPGASRDANLKREGEFIVNRRGRIVRSPSGGHSLFVFEADGQQASEAPMLLLPCQLTQSREDMVQERSDRTVFIVSGQVFVYRGTNYLLPTMMKQDFDRGNIQH